MYPKVFLDFEKHRKEFGEVSALPTPGYLYGLYPNEEIAVSIEEGKDLFIKLINAGKPDEDGQCAVTYELNGIAP